MPLYILVPMILVALPVVIGLVYWTNRNKPSQELTGAIASTRYAQDFPAFEFSETIISDDFRTAFLVANAKDEIGLVHRIGQNYLTRPLSAANIKSVGETGNSIDLYVNDFTLKKISVPVSDKAKRKVITEILRNGS